MRLFGTFLAIVAFVATPFTQSVIAQEPVAEAEASSALFDYDPVAKVFDLIKYNEMREKSEEAIGLTWELGYTMVSQAASDVNDQNSALTSGSFDFSLGYEREIQNLGLFSAGMLTEGGQILSHNDDEDLSANIPSSLGVNDDLDNTNIAVTELWVAQNLFEDKLVVTAGKIDQSAFFDANRVANDETAQFLSTPLVNNPSIAFPDNGLGFNVTANPVEQIAISLGAGDAKAVADESGFNTLDGDEVFVGGEVTFNTEIAGHPGSYRAMVWHVNGGGGADGAGLAIGFDQQILEEGLFIFGRFGTADEDVAAYEISLLRVSVLKAFSDARMTCLPLAMLADVKRLLLKVSTLLKLSTA